jgi:hypothetical protein
MTWRNDLARQSDDLSVTEPPAASSSRTITPKARAQTATGAIAFS